MHPNELYADISIIVNCLVFFCMSIGKTFRYDWIRANSLNEFAKDMKFRPVKVAKILDTVIQQVDREAVLLDIQH